MKRNHRLLASAAAVLGFAVPVVAGQAGQVNAGEVEALLLAVTHEVVEAEFEWNHGNLKSESLQLAQIGDAVGQCRDALHQRESRLSHSRILGHHQHIGEEAVDRRLKIPQNLAQTPDDPLV